MKVRNDFVTNSSSSSFILAKTSELNEKQKEEIIKFVEQEFFGRAMLTPESTEEEIQREFDSNYDFHDEETQTKVRALLREGKSIYGGWISFEDCDYDYSLLFEKLWELMEEHGDGNFSVIDGDLDY